MISVVREAFEPQREVREVRFTSDEVRWRLGLESEFHLRIMRPVRGALSLQQQPAEPR
jgi:hypothetical protein